MDIFHTALFTTRRRRCLPLSNLSFKCLIGRHLRASRTNKVTPTLLDSVLQLLSRPLVDGCFIGHSGVERGGTLRAWTTRRRRWFGHICSLPSRALHEHSSLSRLLHRSRLPPSNLFSLSFECPVGRHRHASLSRLLHRSGVPPV
jgi:hypothetical protein